MAIHIYPRDQVRIDALNDRRIALIGYGNQGGAHALNLRESGCTVDIGQRRGGSGFARAVEDGFEPRSIREAAAEADLTIITLPDESAADIYNSEIAPVLRSGSALGFAHGFNIRYGFINPPADIDVVMVAPKGPGTLLRSLYQEGKGMPALLGVHQDATGEAEQIALAWAAGLGAGRAGVVRTTFASETETDLFGEQAILCGGVTALAQAAFETLVDAGYEPEFAYLECVHELKQIVDLIYAHGVDAMRRRISNTAEYGDLSRGPQLIGKETREAMKRILSEVRDGSFAREWMGTYRKESSEFRNNLRPPGSDAFEQAGAAVRKLMPWLGVDESG